MTRCHGGGEGRSYHAPVVEDEVDNGFTSVRESGRLEGLRNVKIWRLRYVGLGVLV